MPRARASESLMILGEKAGLDARPTCSALCSRKRPGSVITKINLSTEPAFWLLLFVAAFLQITTAYSTDENKVHPNISSMHNDDNRVLNTWRNLNVPNASLNKNDPFPLNKFLRVGEAGISADAVVLRFIERRVERTKDIFLGIKEVGKNK